jgi:acyl-coenzyme A thioesterase PaaI-like protein
LTIAKERRQRVPANTSVESMPSHEDDEHAWTEWLNHQPVYRATNLTCRTVLQDEITFEMDGSSLPLNPNGAVNGGVVAMACDHVMGALGMRVVPTGQLPVTASLNVLFHAPAYAPLRLRATLLNAGWRVLAIRVEAEGSDGRLCSTAAGTMAVSSLQRRAERPGGSRASQATISDSA